MGKFKEQLTIAQEERRLKWRKFWIEAAQASAMLVGLIAALSFFETL